MISLNPCPTPRAPSGRGSPGRGGFTLIEIMVVVLIMGMVAGVVTVSWHTILPNQNLNSDVRQLATRLHGTRANAISFNEVFQVHYNLAENEYWVRTPYVSGGGATYDAEEFLDTSQTSLRDGVVFESVTIDGETYGNDETDIFVEFDPLGKSSNHTIVLYQELFERYFTIEIIGLTGLIKFHDGFYEREPPRDTDFD